MKKYKTGLVLGKFMPLHLGHEYLINFAKKFVDTLYVVVDHLEGETIPVAQRVAWIKEQIPDVKVIGLPIKTPQQPSDHPDFWNFWKDTLITALGFKPDCLIASMGYGVELAKVLDCKFIEGDTARESFPICATDIRNDTFNNWQFLSPSVKADWCKKIVFIGPESTGKSTVSKKLATHFNTIYVPEYAKTIIDRDGGEFHKKNIKAIAVSQKNSEAALAKYSNKALLCDTDNLTTLVWSKMIFNYEPKWLLNMCAKEKYDLTFLFDVDVPFVPDSHRQILSTPSSLKIRKEFLRQFKKYLKLFNRPYILVGGDYANRLNQCQTEIQKLLKK